MPRAGGWAVSISTAAAILALVMLVAFSRAAQRGAVPGPVSIAVQARPLAAFDLRDPARRLFGQLEFRGGLVLSSSYSRFGGISGLRLAPDGSRFIALTDKGWWLRGRLVHEGVRPSEIVDAEMAPILGADGRPLAERGWYDTECIAEDGDTLYVGIERVHQIVRFNYGKDGMLARGAPIAVPPAFRSLPANKGIEGLVFVPAPSPLAGTLVAFSERGLDGAGNLKAFLIGGPTPGNFAVVRSLDYDISDAAPLAGSDLLLLERKFSWTAGLHMRLRRIALDRIRPRAVVDGPILLEADLGYEIDNMEGLSVHPAPTGEFVLTLISDDNFSALQRTLLLQFALKS